MTTVVNNPPSESNSGGPMGMIIGLIALLVVAYLFIMYGLPVLRNIGRPQINVPDTIDVNIKQEGTEK